MASGTKLDNLIRSFFVGPPQARIHPHVVLDGRANVPKHIPALKGMPFHYRACAEELIIYALS